MPVSDPINTTVLVVKILQHLGFALLAALSGFVHEISMYLSGQVTKLDYARASLRGIVGGVLGYGCGTAATTFVSSNIWEEAFIVGAILGGWSGSRLMGIFIDVATHKIRNELNKMYLPNDGKKEK